MAPRQRSTLRPGELLVSGECLESSLGFARLCMNELGDVALYEKGWNHHLWSTELYGGDSAGGDLRITVDMGVQITKQPPQLDRRWLEHLTWGISPQRSIASSVYLEVKDSCEAVVYEDGIITWRTQTACSATGSSATYTGKQISLLLIILSSFLYFNPWRVRACLRRWRRRSASNGSPSDENHQMQFREYQDSQAKRLFIGIAWVYLIFGFLGYLLVASGLVPHYNYAPIYVGCALFVLNYICIYWLTNPSRGSGAVMAVSARTLRVVLLSVANAVVALSHPSVQHALVDNPFSSYVGPTPACINRLERRYLGGACKTSSATSGVVTLHMVMHIALLLPPKEGAVYCILAMLGYTATMRVGLDVDYVELGVIAGIMAVTVLTKYRLEEAQWQLFAELNASKQEVVTERVKRYMAEHKNECLKQSQNTYADSHPSDPNTEIASSDQNTDLTRQFYDQLLRSGGASLEDALTCLETVGRKEKWLIESESLVMGHGQEHILGKGGFGSVIRGLWHGTPVAVKVSTQGKADRDSIQQIVDELRVLRYVRHPNIASCFGACVMPKCGALLLVLELIEGRTLHDMILGNVDSPMRQPHCSFKGNVSRLQLMIGTCQGLRYLHERVPSIVHGDLKPSNAMVTTGAGSFTPRLKLLDFGLSRILTSRGVATPKGGGTHMWMSPEHLQGGAVSTACDMYSFGLMVYFNATSLQPAVHASGNHFERLPLSWPHKHQVGNTCNDGSIDFLFFCQSIVLACVRESPQDRATAETIFHELSRFEQNINPSRPVSAGRSQGYCRLGHSDNVPPQIIGGKHSVAIVL